MTAPVLTAKGVLARERLIDVATTYLAEQATFEVAEVAKRAGVSCGLPYRYFESRTGLLTAVIDAYYQRFGEAAALRRYQAPTWVLREQQRIIDWIDFLDAEPATPAILGGAAEPELATARQHWQSTLTAFGARNIAHAQQAGEISARRDPELLAAATLASANAVALVCLDRTPRPARIVIAREVWGVVAGVVGINASAMGTDPGAGRVSLQQ